MCGILGITGPVDPYKFKTALDTISHRGPDGASVWTDNEAVTLGHRRLAILDLSDMGTQPMHDPSNRYTIIFNGEIYNFLELKAELELSGEKFYTNTDTEVLLLGFRKWKERLFDKLNGMWALAIWDSEERSLFLSRDRFGKKPLFYAFTPLGLVLGSEMKAITPFLEVVEPSNEFNWAAKNVFLYEATDKCLIKGIKRFPAGHHGLFKNNKLTLNRFWNTLENIPTVPISYNEQVEAYRELFIDATKLRMRSDVPLGTALSGGFDSSATLGVMKYLGDRQICENGVEVNQPNAFTASFPGSDIDEVTYAREMCNHTGIGLDVLEIDPLKEFENLPQQMYMLEEIYLTNPAPMFSLYRQIKRNGVSVTLDGHGADEVLAGYRGSLFHAFSGSSLSQKHNLIKTYKSSFPSNSTSLNKRNFSYASLMGYGFYRGLKNKISTQLEPLDREHNNFNKLSKLSQHLYYLTHETILPTLLRNYDRFSMASGVEVRMPFMDHRLICFAMALPQTSLLNNGFTKKVARDALSPYMPTSIAYRKSKIGFGAPMTTWIRGPMKEFFQDTILSSQFVQCPTINQRAVKRTFDTIWRSNSDEFSLGEQAWSEIMPYFWWEGLKLHKRL